MIFLFDRVLSLLRISILSFRSGRNLSDHPTKVHRDESNRRSLKHSSYGSKSWTTAGNGGSEDLSQKCGQGYTGENTSYPQQASRSWPTQFISGESSKCPDSQIHAAVLSKFRQHQGHGLVIGYIGHRREVAKIPGIPSRYRQRSNLCLEFRQCEENRGRLAQRIGGSGGATLLPNHS